MVVQRVVVQEAVLVEQVGLRKNPVLVLVMSADDLPVQQILPEVEDLVLVEWVDRIRDLVVAEKVKMIVLSLMVKVLILQVVQVLDVSRPIQLVVGPCPLVSMKV